MDNSDKHTSLLHICGGKSFIEKATDLNANLNAKEVLTKIDFIFGNKNWAKFLDNLKNQIQNFPFHENYLISMDENQP